MRASCATIAAGERLRLSIAAACFPAFPVNGGNGTRPVDATLAELAIVTLRVRTGDAVLSLAFKEFAPP